MSGAPGTWPGSLRSLRLPSTSGHRLTTGSYDGQTRGYIRQETRPGPESPPNHEEHGLTRGADTFCGREGDVTGPTSCRPGLAHRGRRLCDSRSDPPSATPSTVSTLSKMHVPLRSRGTSQLLRLLTANERTVDPHTPHGRGHMTWEAHVRDHQGPGAGSSLPQASEGPRPPPAPTASCTPDPAACELWPHPRSAQWLRVWSRF